LRVQILPTPQTQKEAAKEQADEQAKTTEQRWTIGLGIMTTVILGFQLLVFGLQAKRLRETVVKMEDIATRQAADAQRSITIADNTLATNKDIERSYVTLSHIPPGIEVSDWVSDGGGHPIRVRKTTIHIKVANLGNTPAMITRTLVHSRITNEPLPPSPPYDEPHANTIRLSLVKGDDFKMHGLGDIPEEMVTRVKQDPAWKLYVLGYVDYMDKFKRRHRVGYARVYNPIKDTKEAFTDERGRFDEKAFDERNNLPFVTQPGYNYDRERKEGEGNDWNEPAQ
jgi:hypothetical protein